jgi:hypothetical protein
MPTHAHAPPFNSICLVSLCPRLVMARSWHVCVEMRRCVALWRAIVSQDRLGTDRKKNAPSQLQRPLAQSSASAQEYPSDPSDSVFSLSWQRQYLRPKRCENEVATAAETGGVCFLLVLLVCARAGTCCCSCSSCASSARFSASSYNKNTLLFQASLCSSRACLGKWPSRFIRRK